MLSHKATCMRVSTVRKTLYSFRRTSESPLWNSRHKLMAEVRNGRRRQMNRAETHFPRKRDRRVACCGGLDEEEGVASDSLTKLVSKAGEVSGEGRGGDGAGFGLERVPRAALSVATAGGAFMVFWCLSPFPGSAYTGLSWHDDLVSFLWANPWLRFDPLLGPESLMLKYNTLGQGPALLHALPGAVWCAIAPFQLARAGGGPTRAWWHTMAGRVMLTSAAVLMVGYAIIDGNHLAADDYDFGGQVGRMAGFVDSTALGRLMPLSFNHGGLKVIAAWFVYTGYKTAAEARGGQWASHRAWAVRHVGAGLWVAAQRPLFSVYRVMQTLLLGPDLGGSSAAQADAFYTCAYLTTLVFFLGAELIARGIWLPEYASIATIPPEENRSQ